ncbi:MAG: hypothetical protein HN411_01220 [Waddliaceae bacterium]|nr:hypothetical protein [Waddliaceae bacterium]MBT3579626.1 hypothetical protein [Waddliaceae bacterium]MBT4444608.1 hypothetical protein [Waddliaceae bacterium]MBT6928129.1 hypothetical protein [Waddliaceae bacterium]MBT7264691.1 hypothetical protein [Waddliaceae bacterium]
MAEEKHKAKIKKTVAAASSTTKEKSPRKKKANAEPPISNEELKTMFLNMKKQSADLKKQTDELYDTFTKVTGKTPKELERLISDENNFSEKDWGKIQKLKIEQEKEFEKLYKKIGLDYKKIKEKKEHKKTAKRRSRLRKKNKNWIPVK